MTPLLTIETIQAENTHRHVRTSVSFAEHNALPASLRRRRGQGPARSRRTLRTLFRSATWTSQSV